MAEYARNFFIAIFLGCLLLGLFIVGTSSTNAKETILLSEKFFIPASIKEADPISK
ncbi:hypothetical protein [Alkalihalobacillus sp. BA299]|uniref:hypothetical protein n=1 Tax=Alkalihalobacillus sp. BA299 TaxID=2815938 RepID=UPI001ADABF04|nr:hypothetical protein [Alkalihalobacillus sp. BA299]